MINLSIFKKKVKMNILDLNTDVQKLILSYLTPSKKVDFFSTSKKALRIAATVDDSFKDKVDGRAAIQKLKNWTIAKLVLGAILMPVNLSLIVTAHAVFSLTTAIFATFLLGYIGYCTFLRLKNLINELNIIDSVERKFNTRKEKNLNLSEEEKKLFPNGLDFQLQRINKCSAAVEAKLSNPARGTFQLTSHGQKYVFEGMYCFDNYYGGKDPWYKRILKVSNGVDENGKDVCGYHVFKDDKFKVSCVKNIDGKLVLEMEYPLFIYEDIFNSSRLIEFDLSK